jgi:hypothetical protein
MRYFAQTAKPFPKPQRRPTKERKGLKPKGEKGHWWDFVSAILTRFFLKIEAPKVCQSCHGAGWCGPLTPAHTTRRQDIPKYDWYHAFRVVPLGSYCHNDIDELGRRDAEPVLEKLRADLLFKQLGLTEEKVEALLLECADELQAEDAKAKSPRFQEFVVTL